ncbi:MAG TPA: hypothetical protein DCP63_13195 [Bacteroidetes bacterium]|nr:hypothetical protein [Bacteroidota bacterium]
MKKNRIIWITGASSGIGRALVHEYVSHGDLVVASARREDELRKLKRDLRGEKGRCFIEPCDVRSERAVSSVANRIFSRHSRLDVLINSAGVTYFREFSATSLKEFDHVVDTNLRGLFLATRAVLPAMLSRESGLIVNILSYAARATYAKSAAYSASKSGAEALMNVLREETRGKGIKVVNVFPGAIKTPMWPPDVQAKYGNQMVSAAEVARVVFEATLSPLSLMIEELVVRPQVGDLKV